MDNSVSVGMAEIRVVTARRGATEPVLTAIGLGSCIGICAYDPHVRVAGMAHVVLPEGGAADDDDPGRYADTGVPALMRAMMLLGARPARTRIAIAGGAHLFSFGSAPSMKIGSRNVDGVLAAVMRLGLSVEASDVGGSAGRTIRLCAVSGTVAVRTVGGNERILADLGRQEESLRDLRLGGSFSLREAA